ncbi:MAG: hypothetical protein D6744_08885 [Planctomycetota bacterium]|nr:MAG: hypothetical protein D6744_08885 [Planctomycetota bacterium]
MAVWSVDVTLAQYTRPRISRPTSGSPSQRVGRTGGLGTAVQGGPDQFSRARRTSSVAAGFNSRLRVSTRELQNTTPLPPIDVPAALLAPDLGFGRYSLVPQGSTFRYMQPTTDNSLRALTNFRRGMGNNTPLTGMPPRVLSIGSGPYYAPKVERDAFAQYFDLKPAQTTTAGEASSRSPGPVLTVADRLELETKDIVRRWMEDGLNEFREGTTLLAENRFEHLSRAVAAFENVMRLDHENYIAPLLITHAALEKTQYQLAGRALIEAATRKPGLFEERIDLAKYYGDPQLLDALMRRNLRIGDASRSDALAYGIQAYVAYVLGDVTRSTEALSRMSELNREENQDARLRRYGFALASALVLQDSAK